MLKDSTWLNDKKTKCFTLLAPYTLTDKGDDRHLQLNRGF
jgi:hypothetical protein